jgi:hypothetical protein
VRIGYKDVFLKCCVNVCSNVFFDFGDHKRLI